MIGSDATENFAKIFPVDLLKLLLPEYNMTD